MNEDEREAAKRRAGEAAVERVEDGMVVGLGSGSTAAHAIDALGEAVEDGLLVEGVPTSYQAAERARSADIPLRTLPAVSAIDVAIDGADQVVDGDLIKGGGGSHTREKLVDTAAMEFVVVVDATKHANRLDAPIPIEILPDARGTVATSVERLGGRPTLRAATAKSGPVVTDNGNLIIDAAFGELANPGGVAATLSGLPGVVDHGLFVNLADVIVTGTASGVDIETL